MNKGVGFALLGLGVLGLTWWGAGHQAKRIEDEVAAQAAAVAEDSIHGATVQVSGRDIVLSGLLDSETEEDALLAALNQVPGRRVVRSQADRLSIAKPYVFSAEMMGGEIAGSGYAPHADTLLAVSELGVSTADVTLASGAPGAFSDAAAAGVAALDEMVEGKMMLEDETLTVTGVAYNPDAVAEVEAALAKLPEGYEKAVELDVLDDGKPFGLSVDWTGDALQGQGKIPLGASDVLASAVPDTGLPDGIKEARINADTAEWTNMAGATLQALQRMEQGTLTIEDWQVSLAGRVDTAETAAELDTLLAAMPEAADVTSDVSIDDPGRVDFTLVYDAEKGAEIDGYLPEGTDKTALEEAMGLTLAGAPKSTQAQMEGLQNKLGAFAPFLSELGSATVTAEDGSLTVKGMAMAGIDPANLGARIGDALGLEGVDVQAGAAAPDGAMRTNAYTGQSEVGQAGYWLPVPAFDANGSACTAEAAKVISDGGIYFVTGSAELDPVSLRTVNNLAGLVLHCFDGNAGRVTIGGHTDAQGDDTANYRLSVQRAKAVLDVLASRGIPSGAMQAVGYGETEPVATNETEEGRAENRRTTFDWAG